MILAKTLVEINSRWYYPLRFMLLLAFGLLIYGQTFGFGFVFDDFQFIVNNPSIRSLDRLNQIWESFPRTRMGGMYSFGLNYFFNQLNPMGYHIFNFFIHFLSALVVWVLSSKFLQIVKIKSKTQIQQPDYLIHELPFIVAVLFIVHPCQIQAVTYVTQRFESMATLFYLSAVTSYLFARTTALKKIQVSFYILVVFFAILGVTTKEVAATIPVMIIAIEWLLWPGEGKLNRKRLMVFLVICTALFSLLFMKLVKAGLDIFAHSIVSESHDGDILTFGNYFLTQGRVFLTFIRLLIFPINQNLEYDYPMSIGLLSPPLTLVGFLVIIGVIILIFRFRRKLPLASVGLAWVLITFSMNMMPRVNVIFEHKLYLISFGFILFCVVMLFRWVKSPIVLVGILLTMVVTLTGLSISRNHVWRNELLLWEDIYQKSPNKGRVCSNLGRIYGDMGRNEEAVVMLSRAIMLNPKDDIAYQNRGLCYVRLGLKEKGMQDYNKAIELLPNYAPSYIRRGELYKLNHQYNEAFADWSTVIKLSPYFENVFLNRGLLLMELGNKALALKDFNKAIELAPFYSLGLIYRGVLYYTMGQHQLALEDFGAALAVQPDNPLIYKNRGFCLLEMGRLKEALKDFEVVLRLDPSDSKVQVVYEKGLREINDSR